MPYELEERIMFDGAAVAAVAQAASAQDAPDAQNANTAENSESSNNADDSSSTADHTDADQKSNASSNNGPDDHASDNNNGQTSALEDKDAKVTELDHAVDTDNNTDSDSNNPTDLTSLLDSIINAGETDSTSNDVYIITGSVPDPDSIINSIPDSANVIHLSSDEGIAEMAAQLQNYSNLDSIHIISEGSSGEILFGSTKLNSSNISDYSSLLNDIGSSLNDNGDILLYGCNIASGVNGRNFVDALAEYTDADVAASSNRTGAEEFNADWNLEYSSGAIETTPLSVDDYQYELAPDPGGIAAGLTLWVKADAGVYTDGGSTAATDGDSVQQWNDQTSNNYDLSQGTSDDRPLYKDNLNDNINFNPTLVFDGTNDELTRGSVLGTSNNELTVFVVTEEIARQSNFIFKFRHTATDEDRLLAHYPWDDGVHEIIWDVGNIHPDQGRVEAPIPFDVGEATIGTFTDSASNDIQELVVNGTTQASHGNTITPQVDQTTLGELVNGKISEFIVYDNYLAAADRNKVESYLALKYGITLYQTTNPTDYTASDGTKMWDSSAANASTYNNDIFGIGRDDDSGLGQVKSKSINSDALITLEAIGEGTNSSPKFSDITDWEFMTFANNDAATDAWSTTEISVGSTRLAREWMVQETGEVGDIKISINDSDLPSSTTTLQLLVDNDGDFSSGATIYNMTKNAGVWEQTLTSAQLQDGQYFTFAHINTPPTASDNTLTIYKDTPTVLTSSDFEYSDPDGDVMEQVQITSLETDGALQYDTTGTGTWTDVTLNQEITKADIDAGRLRFSPDSGELGSPYTTFKFKVSDGTAYSTAEYTITYDVIRSPDNSQDNTVSPTLDDADASTNLNEGIVVASAKHNKGIPIPAFEFNEDIGIADTNLNTSPPVGVTPYLDRHQGIDTDPYMTKFSTDFSASVGYRDGEYGISYSTGYTDGEYGISKSLDYMDGEYTISDSLGYRDGEYGMLSFRKMLEKDDFFDKINESAHVAKADFNNYFETHDMFKSEIDIILDNMIMSV